MIHLTYFRSLLQGEMNHAIDIPSSKVRRDEMYHLCLYLKKGHI